MVTTYGEWIPEDDYTNYPPEKMCDFDEMAIAIRNDNYTPKTDLENIILNVFLYFDDEDIQNEYGNDIKGCLNYVKDSGGWKEFDYYAWEK